MSFVDDQVGILTKSSFSSLSRFLLSAARSDTVDAPPGHRGTTSSQLGTSEDIYRDRVKPPVPGAGHVQGPDIVRLLEAVDGLRLE
jgi:hypothetical protein